MFNRAIIDRINRLVPRSSQRMMMIAQRQEEFRRAIERSEEALETSWHLLQDQQAKNLRRGFSQQPERH